jgi:autotransporter-associated beta strand protein
VVFGTTGLITLGTTTANVITDNQGNPWATYGLSNWAGVTAGVVGPSGYLNVDGATTLLTNGTVNNIVGDFTYSTNATADLQALQFNDPTARTLSISSNRTITARGILVTPESGGGGILPNGSGGFIRPNRSTIANTSFNIIQNSPNDFTIGVNLANASSSSPVQIVKSGSGKLVLTNNNGYTGGTTIHEGTVQVGNGGTSGGLGSGTTAVVNNGTLVFNRSDAIDVTNNITGTGAVQQIGAGRLTLGGWSSTYSGGTVIDSGTLSYSSSIDAFGTGPLTFNGSTFVWKAADSGTTDISSKSVRFGSAGLTLNPNGNNVSLANPIGAGSTGSLTIAGSGTVRLAAANTYSGATTVSGATLLATNAAGSATGLGSVFVTGTGGLGGTGTIGGAVTIDTTGVLTPGSAGIGTLTAGSLTLSDGSSLLWNFGPSSNDLVVVSGSDGLTINAGALTISGATASDPFSTNGTYNLFQYSGSVQGTGIGALTVSNPAAGKAYTFGQSGGYVTLTIGWSGLIAEWNVDASGNWGTTSNWTPSEPNSATDTAYFGPKITAPHTVTLDAAKIVGDMVFNNANAYTIAGANSLTIGDGSTAKTVQVSNGSHTISAPVSMASNVTYDVATGQSLAVTGPISGGGSLTKISDGTLSLSGSNSYTGDTAVNGGILAFANGAISSANLALSGGTLRYATGNTEDISTKSLTLGVAGGTIDTNGNDVTLTNSIGNSGAGGLTKAGAGTLTLGGYNTYRGTTTIQQGVVSVAADAGLGDPTSAGSVGLAGGTLRTTAGFTTSRTVTVSAASTIDVPGEADTFQIGGVVSGAGLLTKTGSGTLVLTANNSSGLDPFRGGITISGGTLTLGGGQGNGFNAIGTGTVTLQNGAVMNLNRYNVSTNATSDGTLANAVVVGAGQSGTINLPGRCTMSGAVLGSGTLNYNVVYVRDDITGDWSGFSGTVNLGVNPYNAVSTSGDFRMGNGSVSFANAKLRIGNNVNVQQNYAPPSTGTLETVQLVGELSGDENANLSGNTVAGRFTNWTVGGLNTSSAYAGRITDSTGASRLTKSGSGTLTLTGTGSTFTGSTTVNGGTLYINSPNGDVGALATSASITINNGGTLRSSANALFGWNANQGKDITVNAGGTLTADDGADVHVGRVTLNGGVLANSGSSVDLGSWVFDGPNTVLAVTETSTASAVNVRMQNGGSIDVAAGKTLSFAGTITDSGSAGASSLVKTGAGTLALIGASSYTGTTAVNGGTLFVDTSLTTTAVTAAAGAAIGGSGTVGSVTMSAGALVAPGDGVGKFTVNDSLVLTGSSGYLWQLTNATGTAGSTTGWDLLTVTGTLTIAATSADPFQINPWTLSSGSPVTSGSAANFNREQSYTWKIASAAGGISGFAADKFVINTSATNGTGGFANTFTGGTFSLAQSGNDLNLVFTGAPPSVITIDVASGTQTQTQAGYPTLSGSVPVLKTGAGTLVVDQANTLTGSTTVQGGVLRLADGAALGSSKVVPLAGGTLALSPYLQTTVGGLAPNAGGLTDVGSGMVIVAAGLSAADTVAAIVSGMGDGTWNGTSGITSSVAAASGGDRTVGWLDNGGGSVTFAFAAAGDTNLDWQVDIIDAANFLAGGKFDSGSPATWNEGDFTYDGVVDILDAASFLSNGLFDAGSYNPPPGTAGAVAAVPEPSVTILGAAGLVAATAALRRRKSA